MTATLTLAEFLLARYAEDEAVANEARPDEHLVSRDERNLAVVDSRGYATVSITSGRVLADLEAHRRIVELHYPVPATDIDWTDCGTCPSSVSGGWPCPTLRALALPYASHPDFRPEWRP